jgi:hypothetical protein
VEGETTRKTVLIAAAGCGVGGYLAEAAAASGAMVIVADHAERRGLALARRAPRRIECLTLDCLRPRQCRQLGEIWDTTPLDILLHLHPLRSPRRLGAAVAAIPALTRALLPGLAQGAGGLVLVACRAPRPEAPPEAHAFDAAISALAPHMQNEAGTRARVNVLRLAQGTGRAALIRAVQDLADGAGPASRGTVIDLAQAGDGVRPQGD